jgi:hypothetical protein
LAWLLTKGQAQIIDKDRFALLLVWMRPKDVKKR